MALQSLLHTLLNRFKSRPVTPVTPPQDVTLIASTLVLLKQLQREAAQQAQKLSVQSRTLGQESNVFFEQVRTLEEQVHILIAEADAESMDGETPNWTEVRLELLTQLQTEQEGFALKGAVLQDQGDAHSQASDRYNQLLLELQVCMYEVGSLDPKEIERADVNLEEILTTVVEFFRDQEQERRVLVTADP